MKWPDSELPSFEPGWVWLVGTGPGDPGLLTVHAVNAINQADAIVFDALVNRAILELAPPGCLVEYAGKRGGKPSAKQRDITFLLIELARKNKRVLRLKGGDPFIFGRGGEEALALRPGGYSLPRCPWNFGRRRRACLCRHSAHASGYESGSDVSDWSRCSRHCAERRRLECYFQGVASHRHVYGFETSRNDRRKADESRTAAR